MKPTFGFLLFDGFEELDAIGPWEMITMWRDFAEGPNALMVAERKDPVRAIKGMRVLPDVDFNDCPPLDFLLIPGGRGAQKEKHNPKVLDFIRQQAKSCQTVLSVCTGALVLYETGLLAGKRVTTHHLYLEAFAKNDDITVVTERFVEDGDIWTSAGISAGMDMAVAFIADQAGDEVAKKVCGLAEYHA